MIWLSKVFIVILLISNNLNETYGEKDGDQLEKRDGLIQEAVKSFLGVKDSLEARNNPKQLPDPPRYMLDLYDSYKAGRTSTQGNTVRSILSMKGRVKGVDMLVFNLTGVQADEQILEGRLHLFRRRKPRVHKKRETANYRLRVMDLRSTNNQQVIEMSNKQGWQSYDVTDMVIKCRTTKQKGDYLLGVSTENQRLSGKYRAKSFKKILRLSSQPFLIIFSEDRNNRTNVKDQTDKDTLSVIEDLLKQVRNDSGQRNLSLTVKDVLTERKKRSTFVNYSVRNSVSGHTQSNAEFISHNFLSNGEKARRDEEIKKYPASLIRHKKNDFKLMGNITADNEFYPMLTGSNGRFYEWYSESEMKHKKKSRRQRRSLTSNDVPYDTHDSDKLSEKEKVLEKYSRKIDPNIIPLPRSMEAGNMFSWRRRKRKRKNRKLPFWWLQHEGRHIKHNKDRVCQRKKLVVDFASIGWSDWVISPNAFESYYCGGRCSFPLIKNGRPSNHATIQSLVHAMNRELHVPAPCCVPSSTSSLTLLYFDENRNVVLKNYPDMIVESCACR